MAAIQTKLTFAEAKKVVKPGQATEEQMKDFVAQHAEDALTFIWNDADVEIPTQFALAWNGYRTVRKFVAIEDDKPLVRKAIGDEIGITDKSQVGAVVSCWETASQAEDNERKQKILATNMSVPRPMPMPEFQLMKQAIEAWSGIKSLPKSQTPHPENFFNHKLDEVEKSHPIATPQDEIMYQDEPETAGALSEVGADLSGALRMMRKKVKGTFARNEDKRKIYIERNWREINSFILRSWATYNHGRGNTRGSLGADPMALRRISAKKLSSLTPSSNPPFSWVSGFQGAGSQSGYRLRKDDGLDSSSPITHARKSFARK